MVALGISPDPPRTGWNRGHTETLQDKLREQISVKDFGAIADGTSHPLSERYATLAAAQADYPHADSLANEIDWAAFQGAINHAVSLSTQGALGARVHVPHGFYVHNRTLTLPEGKPIYLQGDGPGSKIRLSSGGTILTVHSTRSSRACSWQDLVPRPPTASACKARTTR